jgi:ABC-type multidrug transport system fused ATPase/permease subunit
VEESAAVRRRDAVDSGRGLDWRRLLSLAWPERWLLTVASVGLLVSSSSNLIIIGMAGRIVDVLVKGPDDADTQLLSILLVLCIVFVAGSIMTFLRAYFFTLAGERVVARLRANLFSQIIQQEIGFFDENRTGDTLSRLSDDCSVLQNAVTTNISMLLRNLVTAVGTLMIILLISWRLTLVMLAVVPVLAISAVRYGKFVKAISKSVQDALADASSTAEEAVSNVRTVRSFASEGWATYRYRTKLDIAFKLARKRSLAYGSFSGAMYLLANAALIGVLFYGGRLVLQAQLSVGDLLSFVMYTIALAASMGMITSLFNDFMKAVGASKRVFDLIDRRPRIPPLGGEHEVTDLEGRIELQSVTFAYPSRPDQLVLTDLSLSIAAGQTVALVGPSGGGKSTVGALVQRFYDPLQGAVLVDGVDLRRLERRSYMRQVAVVMQEPVLFATSVRDNILYSVSQDHGAQQGHGAAFEIDRVDGAGAREGLGACLKMGGWGGRSRVEGAGDGGGGGDVEMGVGGAAGGEALEAQVRAAASAANALEFIEAFVDGMDTLVGERGVRLSGGQKQRIAIARAIMKQPKVLLLDEATSALDAESEQIVQASINKLLEQGGRTILVVAHRLSTIRNADAIAVIEAGHLVQLGSHDALLREADGVYAKLVSKQMVAGDR